MLHRYARLGRIILFPALSLTFLSFFSQATHGQSEDRPGARMVNSATVNYSRPRRVNTPTESAAKEAGKSWPSLAEATEIEQRAFALTNEARVREGLNALEWDPELCLLARTHSEKMAREKFFSHATPDGKRPKDRARAVGMRFRVIAENIAYNQGFEDPGGFAVHRWMISPGHRANILYVGFQAAAVGVFIAEDGSVYFTQILINR